MIMGLFNKTSDYQKACENKIKELCGGFTPSDYFTEKAYSYKYEKNPSNNNEKCAKCYSDPSNFNIICYYIFFMYSCSILY